MLSWKKDGDKHLRRVWDTGSQSTKEKQVRNGKQFQEQAFQSYSLTAMVEKKKAMAIKQAKDKAGLVDNIPILVACDPLVSQQQAFKDPQNDTLTSLT